METRAAAELPYHTIPDYCIYNIFQSSTIILEASDSFTLDARITVRSYILLLHTCRYCNVPSPNDRSLLIVVEEIPCPAPDA